MTTLATIHVGLKQLGIAEDDARDIYERQTGKRSLREMSPRDHEAVIGELRRLGFRRPVKGARKRLQGRFARKLQALWIAGWNLGLVRNRADEALLAFVKRQTGIDHVRFLQNAHDGARAIEALKGWLAREAGVSWERDSFAAFWQGAPGARIASAQWTLLAKAGLVDGEFDAFVRFVQEHAGLGVGQMTARDWVGVMNTLGERVRRG
ncbi:regulatory protein GemA [Nitratireductor mangrovi]|uniref:Regulatory protein GemA n=1 Tax=Nitratireductor mangrovi TaxID=2599600 RepID=A0A5B8KU16_9HYPH|nr:regulatory protein GemA [Nitratireductor mangrovi]QDY99081.1 regulatory protein GemA [Nitratireductor mangrovi]